LLELKTELYNFLTPPIPILEIVLKSLDERVAILNNPLLHLQKRYDEDEELLIFLQIFLEFDKELK
jgi:hypothetical protein